MTRTTALFGVLVLAALPPAAAMAQTRLQLPSELWAAPPTPDDEEPAPRAKPAPPAVPPAAVKPTDEPGKGSGEPTKPGAAVAGEPTGTVKAKPKRDVLYGVGMHVRGIFVPNWLLGLFLAHSTPLNSAALGAEFVRRKGNFDLVASVNFGFYSPSNGNYMGKNKSYLEDVDYIDFRNLNVLAFDVAFIWHHDFTKWLSLIYGAGLGLGVVLGDIYRISSSGCNAGNIGDLNQCHPAGVDPNSPGTWPSGTGADTPGSPHFYREDGVWPVVPIVHLLLGLNFKITEQISIRLDGGFHDAFYVGLGSHYFF